MKARYGSEEPMNSNIIDWFRFSISFIIAVFSLALWLILIKLLPAGEDDIKNISLGLFYFSLGGVVTQGTEIFIRKIRKKGIATKAVCDFHLTQIEIGVLAVYPMRDDAEDKGYAHDLIEEFENAAKNKKHVSTDDPVKMIGVALERYFGDPAVTKLSKATAECCSSAYFRVLLCNPDNNQELRSKFNLLSEAEKKGRKFDEMLLLNSIRTSVKNIRDLKTENKAKNYLDYRLYEFPPYATIIIVNESIYYTPNMTTFEAHYKNKDIAGFNMPPLIKRILKSEKKLDSNREIGEFELTFRIKRTSKAGMKLENNFNRLWETANKQ